MPSESLRRRWARVFRHDTIPEIDEELRHEIEQRVRDYRWRHGPGISAPAALERFGDLGRVLREYARILAAERRAEELRVHVEDGILGRLQEGVPIGVSC